MLGQEDAVTVPCQSGSAKVGIPWPDSKEPLSSLEYTMDGLVKRKYHLMAPRQLPIMTGGF